MQLRCLNCQKSLQAEWAVCPQCGAAADAAPPLPQAGRLFDFMRSLESAAFWPGALLVFLVFGSLRLLLATSPPLWSKVMLSVVLVIATVALTGYISELMRQTLARPENQAPSWPVDGHLPAGLLVALVSLAYLVFPLLLASLLGLLVWATLGSLHVEGTALTGAAAAATLAYIVLSVAIVLVALAVMLRQLYLIPARIGFFAAFDRFADVEQHQRLVRDFLPRWKTPYLLFWLASVAAGLLLGSCYLVARLVAAPMLVAEAFTAPFAFLALLLLFRWFALVFCSWLPQLDGLARGQAKERFSQLLSNQLKVVVSSSNPPKLPRR